VVRNLRASPRYFEWIRAMPAIALATASLRSRQSRSPFQAFIFANVCSMLTRTFGRDWGLR
jgi:hypothetical protein